MNATRRRSLMSQIRTKDTDIELALRRELFRRGLRYRKHVKTLPGTPDIVFQGSRIAIFVDGDFWHGYRFNTWKEKLSPFWIDKIQKNINRDSRNFSALRRMDWQVIRVWKHQIKNDIGSCGNRIEMAVKARKYK